MFTGEYFDHWVIKMLTLLRAKDLIEYEYNNPYDALDEKCLCKVEKATNSNEAWKFQETEFGARGSDMQHQLCHKKRTQLQI